MVSMKYRALALSAGLLALGGCLALSAEVATAAPAPPCTPGTTVKTANGTVCGLTEDGVTSYLGIPFAAAPTGDLRWKPPQPAHSWRGTFEATRSGKVCTQMGRGGMSGDEDCLNLNVQIPAGTASDAKLPVLVRIHGGFFLVTAFGGLPDSAALAHRGAIAVTINYRLGIMGFLAAKALGPHSGDYGIQDQQAALRWVQKNIARFGGDPHKVAIFGTSAGGASVCIHAMSPGSRGLFQRGISRSGFYTSAATGATAAEQRPDCKSQLRTEAEAQAAGAKLVAKLGCAGAADVAACLRALPAKTIVETARAAIPPIGGASVVPIINGTTVPMSPAVAFATGQVNDVSLIIGVDRDEILGGSASLADVPTTPAQYKTLMQKRYGALAERVMQKYPLDRYPERSPFIAYRTAVADADSVCPQLVAFRNLSRYIPVYAYQVDDGGAPLTYIRTKQLPWGAYHGAGGAMPIVPPPGGIDADQAALYAQVATEWIGFAATGDPTVPGAPLWTRYTKESPRVMALAPAGASYMVSAAEIARQHHCAFWHAVTVTPQH